MTMCLLRAFSVLVCLIVLTAVACGDDGESPVSADWAHLRPEPVGGLPGWVPVDCADRPTELRHLWARAGASPESWQQREREIRSAEPGDPSYVPFPYPGTVGQVIEDFEHWFLRGVPRRPPIEGGNRGSRIYDAIRDGEVMYEVHPVINWRPGRCAPLGFRPYHFLVRVLTPEGKEMARAALADTGILAGYGTLPADRREPIGLREGAAILEAHGVEAPEGVQRVSLSGLGWRCSIIHPCLAARSGDRIYVLSRGADAVLYEIASNSRRRSVAAYNLHLRKTSKGQDLCGNVALDHPILSIGYGWAQARRPQRNVP